MSVAGGHQLAHYNMATLFDELDEFEQAAEHYRRAPDIPNAHYNLARICRLLGDEISAMRHMRRFQETVEDVSPPAVDDR